MLYHQFVVEHDSFDDNMQKIVNDTQIRRYLYSSRKK